MHSYDVVVVGGRVAGALTSVRGLATLRGRISGAVLADGTHVRAGLVVGADGRRSGVAREVAAQDRERHRGRRALYYRYVRDLPGPDGGLPDGAEFSLLGDELAYVFPSDDGVTCLAISVNLDEYGRMRLDARGTPECTRIRGRVRGWTAPGRRLPC